MARKPAKRTRQHTTSKARKPHAKPSPVYKVTGPYSPEQQTAIVERMKARHSPATIQGTIERPDFYVTTDIRATSDPLWRHLAAFRRRLVNGGALTPLEWQCMLIEIRTEAHAAGLRPCLGNVQYIVATLREAREGGAGDGWEGVEDSWSKVILTECGETGWIQLHDLLDGFADTGIPADAHKRATAIEWAESWMNARERQLCQPAALDSHEIDRAAERAAAKAVQAMATRDDPGIGGTDTDWKDVQGQLLAKRDRGEPYTSLRKLSKECGCVDSTIRKAIDKSETLKGWQARSTRPKAAPKATDLGAVVRDNTRQTTEPAPDNYLPDDDVEATMALLIDQATPDKRAQLNALDEAGRRALVAAYQSQNLDDEPSPLEPDKPGERSRKVRCHKRA